MSVGDPGTSGRGQVGWEETRAGGNGSEPEGNSGCYTVKRKAWGTRGSR